MPKKRSTKGTRTVSVKPHTRKFDPKKLPRRDGKGRFRSPPQTALFRR